MTFETLDFAIRQMEKPPCEKYDCVNGKKCARLRLACTSFVYYVNSGRRVNPFMYYPMDKTKGDKPRMRVRIEATRAIFESMRHD